MDHIQYATSCFRDGFSCAQALLSTYGPQLGLDRELALRVAGAFGAGMGRMGKTCGAVTGAFMTIGLKYSKTSPEDNQAKEKAYSLVREFTRQFEARHGTIACSELLGCDLSTAEGRELAVEKNLFETRCPDFVRDAVEIVEQILELQGSDPE